MSCTGRTIREACEKSARFEKSLQPETLFDLYDKENAKNILANCYALGYMDAKKISGAWNNPIPTGDDFKAMLKSWWGWIRNIPPYALSRCGRIGNRKIVVFIKQDIAYMKKEVLGWPNCKVSRNGWQMTLSWMLEDKYVRRGLIKKFHVANNDRDHDKCIWIDEKGLDGYVAIHLRNCNEVVTIPYSVGPV